MYGSRTVEGPPLIRLYELRIGRKTERGREGRKEGRLPKSNTVGYLWK